ncbi:type II secretory pathway protein [Pseudomonas sp. BN417]|uniref:type II secretion system F family protein n=1 Tax=Pseudomonas sp. BN417 TaxID=2567890 RepID=UPI0024563F91|nr:type II secretion system F family protein [Pseudomonas sp. BN417]MDH4556848.1 type II secretory pathway protein [Pseudomonas sp. BN417]
MRYQVKALRTGAGVVALMIEAESQDEARRQAESQGLRVLALQAERRWSLQGWRRREAFPLLLFSQELTTLLLAVALLRQEGVRRALGRQVERLPAIRERIQVYELARFYRSLGILLQGGIPILTAIGMVRGLLGAATRPRLGQAAARIREGQALSRAREEHSLATPVSLRMLRAGEQSGNLGEMMERTADFHDEETSRWIEWFVRLFEPLLMTFIGLIIGVIVILMYIPIFELASSIQ